MKVGLISRVRRIDKVWSETLKPPFSDECKYWFLSTWDGMVWNGAPRPNRKMSDQWHARPLENGDFITIRREGSSLVVTLEGAIKSKHEELSLEDLPEHDLYVAISMNVQSIQIVNGELLIMIIGLLMYETRISYLLIH